MASEPQASSSSSPSERLQTELEHNVELLLSAFASASNQNTSLLLELWRDEHIRYLKIAYQGLGSSYSVLDSSRPWLCYWILHSLAMLNHPYGPIMGKRTIDFLSRCQDPTGGYGGGPGQMPHLATTYAAVNALVTVGGERALASIDREKLLQFLLRMKQPSGGFRMHEEGEIDVRGCYTAISVAHIIDTMVPELVENVAEYVCSCQTYEGGIGGEPGAEAHGGYTFCGLAALALLNRVEMIDLPSLVNWVVFRQGKVEGGFQGRTNKLVDGCYSFWQIYRRFYKIVGTWENHFCKQNIWGARYKEAAVEILDNGQKPDSAIWHGGIFSLIQRMMPELTAQQNVWNSPLWAAREHFITASLTNTDEVFNQQGPTSSFNKEMETSRGSDEALKQDLPTSSSIKDMEMSEGNNEVLKQEAPASSLIQEIETSEGNKDVLKQDMAIPSFVKELETGEEHRDVMMRDVPTSSNLEEVETCEGSIWLPRSSNQNMKEFRNGEEAEATGSAQGKVTQCSSSANEASPVPVVTDVQQPSRSSEPGTHELRENTSAGPNSGGAVTPEKQEQPSQSPREQGIAAADWLFPVVDTQIKRAPISVTFEEVVEEVPDTVSQGERKTSKPKRISVVDQLMNVDEQLLYGPLYNPQALQGYILLCCQVLDGGLRDKPGKSPDYYHTCYCLSGLTLAQDCASHRINAPPPPRAVLGPYNNLLEPVHPLCNIDLNRYYEAKRYFKQQKP